MRGAGGGGGGDTLILSHFKNHKAKDIKTNRVDFGGEFLLVLVFAVAPSGLNRPSKENSTYLNNNPGHLGRRRGEQGRHDTNETRFLFHNLQ